LLRTYKAPCENDRVKEAYDCIPNCEVGAVKSTRKHASVTEALVCDLLVAFEPKVQEVKHLCDDRSRGLREISAGTGMKYCKSCLQMTKHSQGKRVLGASKVIWYTKRCKQDPLRGTVELER